MDLADLMLIAVGLSMDAFAVGMTNGMEQPDMKFPKVLTVALFYGFFQALMPIVGFFAGKLLSELIAKIAPWVSFALLALIGGKMIFDAFKKEPDAPCGTLTYGKLTLQAIATSIDALAVGVSLLAADSVGQLPLNIFVCAAIIAAVTFTLSLIAVFLGKKVGNRFADKAELVGGIVLVVIGIKILIESFV